MFRTRAAGGITVLSLSRTRCPSAVPRQSVNYAAGHMSLCRNCSKTPKSNWSRSPRLPLRTARTQRKHCAPAGTWSVAQDVDLSAGAFVALGEGPEWATFPLAIDSEFGAAPDLYYLQLAAYF